MYRIIGGDGREYGPVTGDTIRQWVVQNRANAKTLVRADNSPDWRPLGEVPEFASSFGAPPPQPPPQPSSAAAAPGTGPSPARAQPDFAEDLSTLTETLKARDYHLDMGRCIGDAFNLLGRKFWLAVGGATLVMFCMIVISFVPFLGSIASILLSEVFYGGLYFFYMKLVRDEPAQVGDAFSGFSRSFGQLVLLTLVKSILLAIIVLPAALPLVGIGLWKWEPLVMVPIACVFIVPFVYLSIAWMFASMLVIDRGYEFWDAMELSRKVVSKHWFIVFLLTIIAGIIGAVGVILLFVGIFFTMPITFATLVYAYETLFPRVGPNESPTVPTTPSTPTAPTEPVTPSVPAEPSAPSAPVEPTEPQAPAESASPAAPDSPGESSSQASPVAPETPAEPGDPASPAEPTDPTKPQDPSNPTV